MVATIAGDFYHCKQNQTTSVEAEKKTCVAFGDTCNLGKSCCAGLFCEGEGDEFYCASSTKLTPAAPVSDNKVDSVAARGSCIPDDSICFQGSPFVCCSGTCSADQRCVSGVEVQEAVAFAGLVVSSVYSGVSDGGHVGWACNASITFTSNSTLDISVSEDHSAGICDVGPLRCTGEAYTTHGDKIVIKNANQDGNCVHESLKATGRGQLTDITYDHHHDTVSMEVMLNFTVKHIDVIMQLPHTQ